MVKLSFFILLDKDMLESKIMGSGERARYNTIMMFICYNEGAFKSTQAWFSSRFENDLFKINLDIIVKRAIENIGYPKDTQRIDVGAFLYNAYLKGDYKPFLIYKKK